MYRLDTRARHHKRLIISGFVTVTLLLAGMSGYVFFGLNAQQGNKIQNAKPVTKSFAALPTTQTQIDTALFSLKLPAGWSKDTGQGRKAAPPGYAYINGDHTQMLSFYMDTPPTTLAVNRIIVASSNGSKLTYAAVSDNCSDYTRPSKANPGSGVATALWQGASFTCDLGNYTRNVVGITSKDNPSSIVLTGTTVGQHKVYFTYNDTAVNPDFSPLYAVLDTFSLK